MIFDLFMLYWFNVVTLHAKNERKRAVNQPGTITIILFVHLYTNDNISISMLILYFSWWFDSVWLGLPQHQRGVVEYDHDVDQGHIVLLSFINISVSSRALSCIERFVHHYMESETEFICLEQIFLCLSIPGRVENHYLWKCELYPPCRGYSG